jgi:serine/threonine protein kinase
MFAGYEVGPIIGRGAMGVVYQAHDPKLGRDVALKVVAEHLAQDEAFRARFAQEAKSAARVEHPGVVAIYQTGEEDGIPFLAMRLVRGRELSAILEDRGKLPLAEALRLLTPIAGGLDAAHAANIVHRDVKPANILVPDDGSDPVLVDFGIGRVMQGTRATQTGSWVGTVDYVSPEQIRGGDVDGRADQYALGCVLYEMVVGEPPFRREDTIQSLFAHANDKPTPIVTAAPDGDVVLNGALCRALAKDPADRFASCGDLIRAAQTATISPTVGAGSTGPVGGVKSAVEVGPTGTVVDGLSEAGVGSTGTVVVGVASGASPPPGVSLPPADSLSSPSRKRLPILIAVAAALVIALGGAAYALFGGKAISISEADPVASSPVGACEEALSTIRGAVNQAATATTASNVVVGTAPYNNLAIIGNRTGAAMSALATCRSSDPSAANASEVEASLQRLMNAKNTAIINAKKKRVVPLPRSREDGNWYVPEPLGNEKPYSEFKSGKSCSAFSTMKITGWSGDYFNDADGYIVDLYKPAPDYLIPGTGWMWGDSWCEAGRGERSLPDMVVAVTVSKRITSASASRIRQAGKAVEDLIAVDGVLAPPSA